MDSRSKNSTSEKPCRVLLMDDDDAIASICTRMLTRLGHSVSTVARGEDALTAYKEAFEAGAGFDVVILDLTIVGGLGGAETLALLREIDPGVRAIASSGHETGAGEDGFVGTLPKPYRLDTLERALQQALEAQP